MQSNGIYMQEWMIFFSISSLFYESIVSLMGIILTFGNQWLI